MNRLLIVAASAVGACAIAVPAAAGLSGNPSFSQRIPVRVPASASVVSFDDHGHAVETHHAPRPSATASPSATPTHAEPGDDNGHHHRRGHGKHVEPGDDRSSARRTEPGDDRSSATRTEPGDDRSSAAHTEPGDDRSSTAHTEPGDDRSSTAHTEPGGKSSSSPSTSASPSSGRHGGDDGGRHRGRDGDDGSDG